MSLADATRLGVVRSSAEFEAMERAARPGTVTWLASLDAFLDVAEDGLRRRETEPVGSPGGRLALRGLAIARELAGEPEAVLAMLEAAPSLGDIPDPEELERVALDALPPERRAAKRRALAQRRAREAGR